MQACVMDDKIFRYVTSPNSKVYLRNIIGTSRVFNSIRVDNIYQIMREFSEECHIDAVIVVSAVDS